MHYEAIKESWEAIPEELFQSLVDSMPRGVEAKRLADK
ncbi:hypothetical protein ACJ73_02600, partial [Blastomyces percursus]